MSESHDDVERAKALLLFLRREGFATTSVKVGDVELVDVVDYQPHVAAKVARAESEDRSRPKGSSAYAEFGADIPGGPFGRGE